MAFFTLNLM